MTLPLNLLISAAGNDPCSHTHLVEAPKELFGHPILSRCKWEMNS